MSEFITVTEQRYTVTGRIRRLSYWVTDPEAPWHILVNKADGAPVMLAVESESLKGYIQDVQAFKEGNMAMRFTYNQWCEVVCVDVLDDAGQTIKTIRRGDNGRPFIGEESEESDNG